jgi:uncharacterized Zn-binding protein involved in type VI secretion/cell division protein FtsB
MSGPPLGARKDEEWYAMCIEPSITKTPVGPVQVPVPYQVISNLSQAMETGATVKLNGEPVYLLDQSKMLMCMGDEQGTSGGSRSGTTSSEVKPVSGSDSVKINGKPIVRVGDKCTLNKENCKGKFIKASPPNKEVVSKGADVKITSSQAKACPDGSIQLTATATPPSKSFEWSASEPFEVVDEKGAPVTEAMNQVYLRPKPPTGDPTAESIPLNTDVHVSVTAYTSNGKAESVTCLPVHPNVVSVKWESDKKAMGEVLLATMQPLIATSEAVGKGSLQLIQKTAQVVQTASKIYEQVKAQEEELRAAVHTFYQDFKVREMEFQRLATQFCSHVEMEFSRELEKVIRRSETS